ncbi:MAG: hypothetical protein U0Q11_06200 [Vicinamibacterales bacterium]
MARLEGMLEQWSDRESATTQPTRTDAPEAGAAVPPGIAQRYAVEASDQRERPEPLVSIGRTSDDVAPLLAFESEVSSRTQTSMFLRAHGVRRPPDGAMGEVLPWRADASPEREPQAVAPTPVAAAVSPAAQGSDETLIGRIDALELALFVAKGELERMSRRHLTLQRRSLASAFLVLLCACLVGVILMQSERRIAEVREDTLTARKLAQDATQRASELAAVVKRLTDSNELIPR